MNDQIKVNVHEFAEGWAVVSFVAPPEDDSQRYSWLDRTLHDWLGMNGHAIQEVRSVRYRGKLLGLSAFYAPGVNKITLTVDVENSLREKFGNEYLEAITADAAKFMGAVHQASPVVALTNRREVTIIVELATRKARMIPLSQFRLGLKAESAKELDAWLAGNSGGYFIVPLSDLEF